ncbi:MAG: flagellar biosynthesis anti-sigma factor FlgM [Pseudomonadota bacterium]
MKIDNNGLSPGNVSPREVGQKEAGRTARSAEQTASAPADRVALSDGARLLGELRAAAGAEPEIDQSRVNSIKARISEGTYHVDPGRLASNFLELESLLDQ